MARGTTADPPSSNHGGHENFQPGSNLTRERHQMVQHGPILKFGATSGLLYTPLWCSRVQSTLFKFLQFFNFSNLTKQCSPRKLGNANCEVTKLSRTFFFIEISLIRDWMQCLTVKQVPSIRQPCNRSCLLLLQFLCSHCMGPFPA